jgi:HD-GYP domain-containing protein (c-di-GMP phosphodiesterase class II)
MSCNPAPICSADQPSVVEVTAVSAWSAHLDRLEGEKEVLGRELARCHEQLDLVFEIAEHLSNLHDPEVVQAALLRRFGAMLNADAVFLDRAGCCMRIELEPTGVSPLDLLPERLRGVLAPHVETVRQGRRALIPALVPQDVAQLHGARVLLGTLQRADTETGVVIAVRSAGAAVFDPGDVLAAEAVLAYGAQALHSVVTVRHLQRTALETVCTLVNAIDAKDNYTSAHSERVGGLARLTGEALELPKPKLQALEWAGLLHDVGKIGVPELILNKPGALTPAEFEEMKKHSRTGHEVLKPVAQFEAVLDAVLYHHESHDGLGYPEGLRGDQIPLDARIIHVVDIFDALTTNRPYRTSYDIEQAIRILEAGAGRATDPHVTRLFIDTLRRFRAERPDEFRARFGHLTAASAAAPSNAE